MYSISTTYTLKWVFINHPHIKVAKCKTIINTRTNRKLKMTVNGGSIRVWIGKEFILRSKINQLIIPIPKKEYCPF